MYNSKKRNRLAIAALFLSLVMLMAACNRPAADEETTSIPEEADTVASEETTATGDDETSSPEETTAPEFDTESSTESETEKEVETVTFEWRNPVNYGSERLRDPFILKVGDAWYMTGTLPPYGLEIEANRTKGVPLYRSTDLKTWDFVDYIVETPAEAEGKWYSERFWAPELFSHNGKFYVTVNCCAIDGDNHGFLFAVADDIEGPYTIMNPDAPLALGNDAHLFSDVDGQTYVFASDIRYAKIDLDTLTLLSHWQTPVAPVPDSDAWNAARPGVGFEGPFVLTAYGKYYMFYSTWGRGYEIGLASAESVTGDWDMYPDPMYGGMNQGSCDRYGYTYEPDYYENQSVYRECGHNCVFEGPDGNLWIAAHAYVGTETLPRLIIDRLVFDEERGILCLDTATGQTINGPTRRPLSVTYDPTNNEAAALHALDVWKYVNAGDTCVLPDQVEILLENGFRRAVDVVWEGAPDTAVAGTCTVNGTATYKGVTYPVTARITVSP